MEHGGGCPVAILEHLELEVIYDVNDHDRYGHPRCVTHAIDFDGSYDRAYHIARVIVEQEDPRFHETTEYVGLRLSVTSTEYPSPGLDQMVSSSIKKIIADRNTKKKLEELKLRKAELKKAASQLKERSSELSSLGYNRAMKGIWMEFDNVISQLSNEEKSEIDLTLRLGALDNT